MLKWAVKQWFLWKSKRQCQRDYWMELAEDGNIIQNIFLDFNGNSVIHVCSESNHGDSSENEVKFSRIAVSPVFMPD